MIGLAYDTTARVGDGPGFRLGRQRRVEHGHHRLRETPEEIRSLRWQRGAALRVRGLSGRGGGSGLARDLGRFSAFSGAVGRATWSSHANQEPTTPLGQARDTSSARQPISTHRAAPANESPQRSRR